jgi:nicotinamide mononucleotide transporter
MPMNPLEVVAVAFGIVSVWLIAHEKVWGWPTGIVNVAVFILVFFEARLYADMGLQAVYVVLCTYGWYQWTRGGRGHAALRVSRAPRAAVAAGLLAGAIFAATLGLGLDRHTNAALPWLDASTTSFSLVAQWLQTRKWIENWLLWIVVDVVYVGMYVSKALYLTAGLYLVFLVLAGIGLTEWRRSLTAGAAPSSS